MMHGLANFKFKSEFLVQLCNCKLLKKDPLPWG